ncbi:transcription factor ETV6 [Acrasis kona]|uniref:Transcription factor ETV6 n=1 Tax=Acrasis kona TaxID=1008807 RepID=A0AAW2YR61_9EUKA
MLRQISTSSLKQIRYFSARTVLLASDSSSKTQSSEEGYGLARASQADAKQAQKGQDEVLQHRQANKMTTRLHDPSKDAQQTPQRFERDLENEK